MTIGDNACLKNVLVADNVEIGHDSTLKDGVMVDRNCMIKPNTTLEPNTIVSSLTITTNDKGIVSFTPLPV